MRDESDWEEVAAIMRNQRNEVFQEIRDIEQRLQSLQDEEVGQQCAFLHRKKISGTAVTR